DRDVLPEKTQIPYQKSPRGMIVRIFFRSHKAMMLVVSGEDSPIEIKGEKDGCNPTCEVIETRIGRHYTMHGIVRGDKQPGIKMHLHKHSDVKKWAGPAEVQVQQKHQRDRPSHNDSP